MKNWYQKTDKRIVLPWGGLKRMSRHLRIGDKALGRILDGQRAGKWHFEYSFEEIRNMALTRFEGKML